MCEPTTIALAMSAAGTAMTVYSSIQQGNAAEDEAQYNSDVSKNNAIREQNKGIEEENDVRIKNALTRKEQEAHYGANNIQLDSGSAATILSETDRFGEYEALNIRQNTADRVANLNTDADISLLQGANAKSRANNQAFSSLLSGAGQVSSKWYKNKVAA